MSLPLVGGVYHHGAAVVLDIPYAAFGQAVGMMSVYSGKLHALWVKVLLAGLDPVVGAEDTIVSVVVQDLNTVGGGEQFKSLLCI